MSKAVLAVAVASRISLIELHKGSYPLVKAGAQLLQKTSTLPLTSPYISPQRQTDQHTQMNAYHILSEQLPFR